MKRLSALRMLLAGFALAAASSAGAQVAEPAPQDASATPAAAAAQAADDAPARRTVADHHCLRETGSLIRQSRRARRDAAPCLPVPGRAYSGDELRRTGQPDIAQALRELDPSVY